MATYSFVALLLEDEPLIAMDIEMNLGAAGFRVSTVASCVEAHSWLDANVPDVVIVDIKVRDGLSTGVVSRLVDADIRFVVHSGDPIGQHAGTPFAQGAWVNKPASSEELLQAAQAAVADDVAHCR